MKRFQDRLIHHPGLTRVLQARPRIRSIRRKGNWRGVYRFRLPIELRLGTRHSWRTLERQGLRVREYRDYPHYVRHQRSKLRKLDLAQYEADLRSALHARLSRAPELTRGMSVLCLAARLGAEVRAFGDVGCFAVGVDLNPGRRNHVVLPGDVHSLQFASSSVDVVYTNAFDHVLEVDQVISEIRRVLKPGGLFILEAVPGTDEGNPPGQYESFWWSDTDELVGILTSRSFALV